MVTSEEVAQRAGVSRATVSYVMSGKRTISEKTRAKVLRAMDELGYYPNANARALAGRRSGVIGVVSRFDEGVQMPEFLPFFSAILSTARKRGYDVILVPGDEGVDGIRRMVGQSLVDGVLVFDIRREDDRLEPIAAMHVPAVLIGTTADAHGLACVDVDYAMVARLAVDEAADCGANRMLLVADRKPIADEFVFAATFEDVCERRARERGLAYEVFRPEIAGWRGFGPLGDLLERHADGRHADDRCALVTRTPRQLDWTLQLMLGRGIRAGEDMAVIGVCVDGYATSLRVDVTNVDPHHGLVAERATDELLDLIDGKSAANPLTLVRPELHRRTTTLDFRRP
ncbi:LacI family DNA-binding transcriptional regulator [Bifidobacterium avesanii]|uniref:LacI family DNA-binding transcriptional regulator n=1 Tax=Bifidobacterium avesanii TaxID=1798157 RepID=A0A7K3THL0_9BIFI|nr:LacI family DNA-binding transcriptional regulator [Bifidobacterium avesanii]KAB8294602.1 LacI family transcriptional regulator [Bifidobacterium avesanii]NEG78110.1 LacI family DNA-binding transcriptional regulator [Bifidobacterium avesanii]